VEVLEVVAVAAAVLEVAQAAEVARALAAVAQVAQADRATDLGRVDRTAPAPEAAGAAEMDRFPPQAAGRLLLEAVQSQAQA
jgi:hypothetical protein